MADVFTLSETPFASSAAQVSPETEVSARVFAGESGLNHPFVTRLTRNRNIGQAV
jgi:hypothetical protein